MKRLVALLLCLVMGAAMLSLAACPAQDTPTPEPGPAPEPGKSTYTVTFEGDGVTTPAQTVAAGGTAIRPRDPEKEGYAFEGWFAPGAETPFDFAAPITADIVLTAHFHVDLQNGTAENPYRIASVADFLAYLDKINHPEEEGNEGYRTAHYLLAADLDMTGVNFQPIGRSVTLREGEKDEQTLPGFAGYFDGGGHTIRNLTITRALRQGIYYIGFFGETDRAFLHDLTLENIAYGAESGGNVDSIGLYMGGLVARANLTTIRNVTVSGALTPALCEKNRAFIGGLCGGYEATSHDDGAYITYLENCLSDVTIEPGRFSDDDSAGVFASSVVAGGVFGEGYGYGSTAAILNVSARGKVAGGRAAGGIAGQVTGSWFSFVNCASSVSVSAVTADVTYTGGIAGYMAGDHTVMDCLSLGRVKGTKAPVNSTYKSMAGGIVGFAEVDDYELYYTAGVAIINCHYKNNISTYDQKNQSGTALNGAFDAAFAADTLRWGTDMTVNADGAVTPAKKTDAPRTVRLTTKDGESVIASTERETGNGTVALVGAQDDLPHGDGRLFFDWGFTADVRYRSYVPMVKDMTLVAQWGDADALAASYTGTCTLYDTKDAGTLALYRNGTLEWFTSASTVRGRYTTDGKHLLFSFFNGYGDVSGTCEGGTLTYSISAGMSGNVAYTMRKNPSLAFIGEYYSADGDTLTFTGENSFTFRAENVKDGRTQTGTYTRSGSTLTFTSTALSDLYTATTATVDAEGNLALHFHPKAGAPEYNGTVFSKIGVPDYTGKAILGEYHCSYTMYSGSDSTASQSDYTVFFRADGTVVYRTKYSDNNNTGSYFLFRDDTYVVLTLDGNTSILHFDAETRTVYGFFDRGVTAKYPAIHTPAEYGDQKVFVLDNGTGDVLVAAGTHRYLLRNAAPVANAAIIADDLSDGARVTVEGKDYFAKYDERGYRLLPIGAEEGTYTAFGASYTLDGIGHVTGTKNGTYRIYGTQVVIVFEDNSVLSFDVAAARASSSVFTALAPDALGGVWFLGGNYTVENEDGEEEKIFDPERYKLVIDGFGYVAFLYRADPTSEYRNNWGSSGWVPYIPTAAGIYAQFNEYQKADILFYYDRGLAYSKSFGYMGEVSMTAPGYTGEKTPPALPANLPGKYTGTTADGTAVVFNLLSDLTGSYAGRSFSGVWDGGHRFLFAISGTNYVWDTETMTLSYDAEAVKLTAAGAVTEVIPAGLCGIWSGTWSGMGMGASGRVQTIEIRTDGTVIYDTIATFTDARYDVATGRITAEIAADEKSIVITMDAATGKASAVYYYKYDESAYQHECRELTRQA